MAQYRVKGRVRSRQGDPLAIYPDCSQPPYLTYDEATPIESQCPFIFLWMPKVAGMSISGALKVQFGMRYLSLENAPKRWEPQLKGVTFYHSHVPALVDKGYVLSDWVDKAFKFAFVRNPWDRLVSLYHWLRWEKKMDFHTFIEQVTEGNYVRPGIMNLRGLYQANRLVDWLRPDGVWLPQYIGRFENLQEDWRTVTKILGCGYTLTKRNTSKHTHYRDYYDPQTRDLVAQRFEEDIDLFKYTFEG